MPDIPKRPLIWREWQVSIPRVYSARSLTIRVIAPHERNWRKSWYYEYNYEKEFPYTPNVRGVRTDDWKYIRYPDGAGGDQYKAELYNMKNDPLETKNLIDDPAYADKAKELREELDRLIAAADGLPDKMPVHPEMKMELPDEKIR